jgi:hypothetical protein
VFGGDGATLMVPGSAVAEASQVLLGVRDLASKRFDLSLRVGVVPVTDIHQHSNARVMVAKYRLSRGNELAAFAGGGIETAERWIKADSQYLYQQSLQDNEPDLSGLSCRWEPLAAQHGVMLSLLMQANSEDETVKADLYRGLIEDIDRITASAAKPVCAANMLFRWPPRGLRAEIRATVGRHNRSLYALRLYLGSLLQWALDRFDISAGGYPGRQYRVELRNNTDYQRFDDTLRILLDCSEAQAEAIDAALKAYEQQGILKYGLHRSDSALMTCLVFNLHRGEHIHFVDGSNGGFTAAAKVMKAKHRPSE